MWHSNSSIRISFVHDIHRHYFSRHTRSSTQPPPSTHYSYCNNVWGGEKSSFQVSVPRDGTKKICPVWESGKWRCGKKRRTRAPPIRLSFGQRPFFFFHRFPAQTPLDAGDIHIHHSLLFLLFSSANPSYPFFCPKEPLFSRRKKPPSFPLLSKSHQLERRDRTLKEGRRGPPSPPFLLAKASISCSLWRKANAGAREGNRGKGNFLSQQFSPWEER